MFEKVLVPLDGSPESEEALTLAKGLLRSGTAAEVTLFRVGEPPRATPQRRAGVRLPLPLAPLAGSFPGTVIQAAPPAYHETKDQAVERREHELLEYLDTIGRPLLDTGRPVHVAVHFGEPAGEIIAFACEGGFDLIVMSTHAHFSLLHGSVTAAVVRSGVAPVLITCVRGGRADG